VNQLTAAVVGLGRIGQGYDYDPVADNRVLTHASAFAAHPRIELVAGVDPDPYERERFTRKFSAPAYPDAATMQEQCQPDVIALCTPTNEHYAGFRQLIAGNPRAIICEKPIAPILSEAREMVRLAAERHCVLLVNYMRRFEPGTRALAKAIRQGRFGEIYKGAVWYSKGLLNNGSHFIDLLCFMLGNSAEVEYVRMGRDWNGNDPEPDCCLRFGTAHIYLLAAREECYSMYTMELVGTKGVASYLNGGEAIRARFAAPDPVFSGSMTLQQPNAPFESAMGRYQWHVLEALLQHLDTGQPLASDGASALNTLSIIDAILSHLQSD
jgi:predicted dehydrogenase